MRNRSWKREQATSLSHGTDLCIKHAHEVLNLSVPQISDFMGESHHTVYKWLSTQRMPVKKIISFEKACGVSFVTQYLAHASNKMLVDLPTGRKATHRELNELASYTHKVMGMLIDFTEGGQDQEDVVGAVTLLMEDLAHQRGKVERQQQRQKQPDLGLD